MENKIKQPEKKHLSYDTLGLYHDKVADESTRSYVEGHLKTCLVCQHKYEGMADTLAHFTEEEVTEQDKARFRQVMAAATVAAARGAAASPKSKGLVHGTKPTVAAARVPVMATVSQQDSLSGVIQQIQEVWNKVRAAAIATLLPQAGVCQCESPDSLTAKTQDIEGDFDQRGKQWVMVLTATTTSQLENIPLELVVSGKIHKPFTFSREPNKDSLRAEIKFSVDELNPKEKESILKGEGLIQRR